MHWVDIVGWTAAALTLGAFSMRTMMPLRIMAIAANICFVLQGYLSGIYPILVLHSILLPLNAYRLAGMVKMARELRTITNDSHHYNAIEALKPLLKTRNIKDGTYIFRQGDPAKYLYFVDEGKVFLEELNIYLEPGEIFGEIAFFTNSKSRSASARCVGDCTILEIDEAGFTRLYYQNPAFSFYVTRLIANRLS